MDLIRTKIRLSNPSDPSVRAMEVQALVDTGAQFLCLPPEIADELKVPTESMRRAVVANGTREDCRYVGPVRVQFENRRCLVGALVMGTEVLLGAMPMQDMDLVIAPSLHKVTPNPDSPDIGIAVVK